MAWLIGIDEAGYGPNLGPLVMTSVACRVAGPSAGVNLWKKMRAAVREPGDEDDGRVVVADSKVVYTSTRGLADLEKAVLVALGGPLTPSARLLQLLSPAAEGELEAEPWYTGQTPLPIDSTTEEVAAAAEDFSRASTDERLSWFFFRSEVVCARRFNQLVDKWDSKGAVLGLGLTDLLRANVAKLCHGTQAKDYQPDESMVFVIDKHGGRNHYAAMVQHAFDEAMVVAREERMDRSAYHVLGLDRDVEIIFEPRADARHFCVALASMISKYVREVLMVEFNAFWQKHVPDLKPTAGYPGDSTRYMDAIRPTLKRLGISEECVWRTR